MASGRRHWRERLRRLGDTPSLTRSQRRQYRKLLGRLWRLEWRLPTRTPDRLNEEIVTRARTVGHVAQRLEERGEPTK